VSRKSTGAGRRLSYPRHAIGNRFDPATLAEIARRHAGPASEERFERLAGELADAHPGLVSRDQPWLFSNAGGAMVQMRVLYASLSEYVLIFGTAVGTSGHTGRHAVEFFDVVLDGEAWYQREGTIERNVYRAGDAVHVRRGEAAAMHIPDRVWMLEYARGAIALSLPFGLADTVFSTFDMTTFARTLRVYTTLTFRSFRARQ